MCGSCLNKVNDGYTQPQPLGWYKLKGKCLPCRNFQDPTFIIFAVIFVLIGGAFFVKFAKYLGKMGSLKIFINFDIEAHIFGESTAIHGPKGICHVLIQSC